MKRVTLLLLFAASVAHGEIYTWTDSKGAAHYTNRMDEIPVRYRSGARSLNYGDEQPGATSQGQKAVLSPENASVPNAAGSPRLMAPSREPAGDNEQIMKRREGRRERKNVQSPKAAEQEE